MIDWGGGVLQEIEIDTEHFDLHKSVPVDEDVRRPFLGVTFLISRPFMQTLNKLQKELDVDKDGKVTWEEFEKVSYYEFVI